MKTKPFRLACTAPFQLVGAALILLAAPTPAAEDAPPLEGFYLGASAAASSARLKGEVGTLRTESQPDRIDATSSLSESYEDLVLGLHGGYGHYFGDAFAGLELDLQRSVGDFDERARLANHDIDVTRKWFEGVSLLGGWRTGDRGLVYGRIGIMHSDLSVALQEHPLADALPPSDWGAVHDPLPLRLGLGGAWRLTDRLSLRAEYNWLAADLDYDNDKDDGETYRLEFREHRVGLGLNWAF